MAEHVHQNLEGMLPELEDMEQMGIFTRKEIRTIIKKRTEFEYGLQKRATQKQDFIKYIQYEINLDIVKKKRKMNLGLKKTMKGEHESTRRLHTFFKKALLKFKHDIKLWLQYIEYCKKTGAINTLGKVFGQLLQFHPHNPSLWVMAAKWEFENSKNIPAARTLLQRGLRMNSTSKLLWLEYFRMELLHVDKVLKRRKIFGLAHMKEEEEEHVTDAFLAGKAAEIVFTKAVQEIPEDIDFRLSFLKIYRLFDNTKHGQDQIFESLEKDFNECEEYWSTLACRSLNDLQTCANQRFIQDSEWIEAEKEQERIFEQAVKTLATEKMWDLYITACTPEVNGTPFSKSSREIQNCLHICSAANNNHLLSNSKLKTWVCLLLMTGETSQAIDILRKRISDNNSTELYVEYLRLLVVTEDLDNEALKKEFWDALNTVSASESLALWEMFVDWSMTNDVDNVSSIFEKSLMSHKCISEVMKERYIEWLVTAFGISKARKVYNRCCKAGAVSLPFLWRCIELEQAELLPSLHHIRLLYDVMLDKFGTSSSECWLEYIRLELAHSQGKLEKAGQLHWRAMKALSGVEMESFVTNYSLLQANRL